MTGGGGFKIYDQAESPNKSGVLKICGEPDSPQMYGEPESPNEGYVHLLMMNRHRQTRGHV